MRLKLPNGQPAGNMDPLMLLATWGKWLQNKWRYEHKHDSNTPLRRVYNAGLGKPTYPFANAGIAAATEYWGVVSRETREAREFNRKFEYIYIQAQRSAAAKLQFSTD